MPEDQQPQDGSSQQQTPPWGSDDDFKPDKAWSLIQNLRGDLGQLKSKADEYKSKADEWAAFQRESQPEVDRLRGDLSVAQQEAQARKAEAEQLRKVAFDARVQSLATGYADPTDANTALTEMSRYFGTDGVLNDDAIKADLEKKLNEKPHWRKADQPRTPRPFSLQGSGGNPPPQDGNALMNSLIRRNRG